MAGAACCTYAFPLDQASRLRGDETAALRSRLGNGERHSPRRSVHWKPTCFDAGMETVAGVFRFYRTARNAAGALGRAGFSEKQANLLSPASSERAIHAIPASGTERPGVGGAIGGMLGGALGVAGGLELGMAAAVLIPGVGPALAFGLAGAALLGAGGAAGGAALGNAADDRSNEGVPSDEIFFCDDALRQGRSLVLVLAADHSEEQRAHKVIGGRRGREPGCGTEGLVAWIARWRTRTLSGLGAQLRVGRGRVSRRIYFGPAPRMPRQVDRRGGRLLEVVVSGCLGFRVSARV